LRRRRDMMKGKHSPGQSTFTYSQLPRVSSHTLFGVEEMMNGERGRKHNRAQSTSGCEQLLRVWRRSEEEEMIEGMKGASTIGAHPRPGSNNSPVCCVCVCCELHICVSRRRDDGRRSREEAQPGGQSTFIHMHLGWCVY
jgi:hypothetical protein